MEDKVETDEPHQPPAPRQYLKLVRFNKGRVTAHAGRCKVAGCGQVFGPGPRKAIITAAAQHMLFDHKDIMLT